MLYFDQDEKTIVYPEGMGRGLLLLLRNWDGNFERLASRSGATDMGPNMPS